jgi:hypothetical protein
MSTPQLFVPHKLCAQSESEVILYYVVGKILIHEFYSTLKNNANTKPIKYAIHNLQYMECYSKE